MSYWKDSHAIISDTFKRLIIKGKFSAEEIGRILGKKYTAERKTNGAITAFYITSGTAKTKLVTYGFIDDIEEHCTKFITNNTPSGKEIFKHLSERLSNALLNEFNEH